MLRNKNKRLKRESAYLILGQAEVPNAIEAGRRSALNPKGTLISSRKQSRITVPCKPGEKYAVSIFFKEEHGWFLQAKEGLGNIYTNGLLVGSGARHLEDQDFIQIGATTFQFVKEEGMQYQMYARVLGWPTEDFSINTFAGMR